MTSILERAKRERADKALDILFCLISMASTENLESQRDVACVWVDRRCTAITGESKRSESKACGTRHDVKNPRLNTQGRDNPNPSKLCGPCVGKMAKIKRQQMENAEQVR